MAAALDTIIAAIAVAIPSEDPTAELKSEIQNVYNESPTEGDHDIVQRAVQNLRVQNKITGEQYENLDLAVETAKISGNNGAIVKAVMEASRR